MPGSHGPTGITPEQRRDVLEAVRGISGARVSPSRWDRLEAALDAVAQALAADDPADLDSALTELALADTLRIRTRLGDDADEPPERIRERLDRIRHAVSEEAEAVAPRGRTPPNVTE
ncbi:CATRA system-associated protein [Streptomyces sp. NPDC053069]|uniref:CATRA system-associated protein n=1 Tax=Streptomyces sp. NPDC053069 TaxID=3365695 RepID=UPI0037CCDE86